MGNILNPQHSNSTTEEISDYFCEHYYTTLSHAQNMTLGQLFFNVKDFRHCLMWKTLDIVFFFFFLFFNFLLHSAKSTLRDRCVMAINYKSILLLESCFILLWVWCDIKQMETPPPSAKQQ